MKLNKSGENKHRMELLLGNLSRQTVQVGQTSSVGKALPESFTAGETFKARKASPCGETK